MTTQSRPRRRQSFVQLLLVCMLIGAGIGVVSGLLEGLGLAVPPVVSGLVVLAVGGLVLWLSARWWIVADEAVREAHKFSWFWGGSAGMVLVGAVAVPLPPAVALSVPVPVSASEADSAPETASVPVPVSAMVAATTAVAVSAPVPVSALLAPC